jgi:hypothetical protein
MSPGTGRDGTARRGDVGPSRARACAGRGRDRAHDPEAHPWGLGLQRRGRQPAVAGPSRAHRPGALHADAADGGQQRATGPEWGVGRGRVAGFLKPALYAQQPKQVRPPWPLRLLPSLLSC